MRSPGVPGRVEHQFALYSRIPPKSSRLPFRPFRAQGVQPEPEKPAEALHI